MILEQRSEEQTVAVDKTLRLLEHPYLRVMVGGDCVSEESDSEICRLARLALQLWDLPIRSKVAVLGGGTMILPRLLTAHDVTVFELEGPLVEEMVQRYAGLCNVVVGDFRQTLTGKWDAIVDDIFPRIEMPEEWWLDRIETNGRIVR